MAAELAKCQTAMGNGCLSAFPEELFDRLRAAGILSVRRFHLVAA
jgi:hypothetical protein